MVHQLGPLAIWQRTQLHSPGPPQAVHNHLVTPLNGLCRPLLATAGTTLTCTCLYTHTLPLPLTTNTHTLNKN